MKIGTKIKNIKDSASLALTTKANELKARGYRIFNMAAGEPDFDTPQQIKDSAILALNQGKTKYAPTAGVTELRTAIAEYLKKYSGIEYTPNQIVVCNGAKQAIFNVLAVICDPGDEVLIPSPYWLSYPEMVRIVGGIPKFIKTSFESNFKLKPSKLEQSITKRTKCLILNYPSNPDGHSYTRQELEELSSILEDKNIWVISDECYNTLWYDEKPVSFATFSEKIYKKTITINALSKSFSMTGWRTGYLAGPQEVVDAVIRLQSHTTSGINTFCQYGAITALRECEKYAEDFRMEFKLRRDLICDLLSKIKGIRFIKPAGAFYVFVDISSIGMNGDEFAMKLLEEKGVVVVPGKPFGMSNFIRLSFACSEDNIKQAVQQIEEFIAFRAVS